MLAIARQRAADAERRRSRFLRGDAHALEFADRRFDVVVSLRVLMHTPRVAAVRRRAVPRRRAAGHRRLSVGDAASRCSSRWRGASRTRWARRPSRTACSRDARSPRRSIAHGFRIRSVHRQFVLPIALHKAIGSRRFTTADRTRARSRRPAAAVRLAGHARRRTVRVLVTGATGFTGGHLARALAARGDTVSRAGRATPAAAAASGRGGHRARRWATSRDRDGARARRPAASTSSTTSPRSTGRPASPTTSTAPSTPTAVGDRDRSRGARPASGASCTAAPSACTATSSIRRPTRTRRSSPGDIYQVTKLEGERLAREAGARARASRSRSRGRPASTVRAIGAC